MISVATIASILDVSNKTARRYCAEPYELHAALVRPSEKGGRPHLVYHPVDVATRLRHLGKIDAANKIIATMEQIT